MARPIRSLSQRLAAADVAEALKSITATEHLLALILIELMQTRGNRGYAELSKVLRGVGFSQAQAAAILQTTTATLSVSEHRAALQEAETKS